MTGHPRIEFVLEAIGAALVLVAPLPASQESKRLLQEAEVLRGAVDGWRRSPPNRAMRDEIMRRVLHLHAAAGALARLSSAGAAGPRAGAAPQSPERSDSRDEHQRTTAPPPFDIEAFAREATAPDSAPGPASAPPTQRWQYGSGAEGPDTEGAADIDIELENALAPLENQSEQSSDAITARQPAFSVGERKATPPPRSLSPSSIERAVLGAVEGPTVSEREIDDPCAEMLDCFALGDYAGAIALADLVLSESPESLVARECRADSHAALEGIYSKRLGAATRVPIVVMAPDQIDCLEIDHRAGFLLSLVDGSSSIEAILDVCGMPKLDALRILHELVQRGAVGFG